MGIVFKFNVSIITEKVLPLMNQVDLGTGMMLGTLANSLAIVLICVGVFIVCLALAGTVGACCEIKCLLVIVSIFYASLKFFVLILFSSTPKTDILVLVEKLVLCNNIYKISSF